MSVGNKDHGRIAMAIGGPMKKIMVALVATLVAISMSGCVYGYGFGKGKGKAPPPIVRKG